MEGELSTRGQRRVSADTKTARGPENLDVGDLRHGVVVAAWLCRYPSFGASKPLECADGDL